MISKAFCKKVVHNHALGKMTITKSHNWYFAEYVGLDGKLDPGIYIRRIDPNDKEYAPIVASYHMGSGWIICG